MEFDVEEIGEEGLSFSLLLNKDQLEIDQKDLSISIDIAVNGSLTRLGDDIFLNGNVVTCVIASCSRCLDTLSFPIDSDFKSHFISSSDSDLSKNEVELSTSDIDTEVYENQQIDLTQSVRDGILLAVPVICLCADSCKGICSQCGKNLNQGLCNCLNESFVDPRLESLSAFKNKFLRGE